MNEYKTQNTNIYHFDVYRLEDEDEFFAIGGTDYFEDGISIIEWGNLIENILPENYIKITFSRDNNYENVRYIKFEAFGDYFEKIIKEIEEI